MAKGKLRPWLKQGTQEIGGYNFYCPGCLGAHSYWTHPSFGKQWTFNGNMEKPSFAPSLRLFTPEHTDPETGKKVPEKTICHLFVTDGVIRYCGDCVHRLNGQVVQMVDFPENYADGCD